MGSPFGIEGHSNISSIQTCGSPSTLQADQFNYGVRKGDYDPIFRRIIDKNRVGRALRLLLCALRRHALTPTQWLLTSGILASPAKARPATRLPSSSSR